MVLVLSSLVYFGGVVIGMHLRVPDYTCPGNQTLPRSTIVLMAYYPERSEMLADVVSQYTGMVDEIDRVVFIWNNLEVPCPVSDSKRVLVIRPHKNDLNNRFDVSAAIQTETVIHVDDDILLTRMGVRRLIYAYYEPGNRHSLIGYDKRSHLFSLYLFFHLPGTPQMTLTKSWIVKREFLSSYMASDVAKWVSSGVTLGCEDLAFCFFHRNASGLSARVININENQCGKSRIDLSSGNVGLSHGLIRWWWYRSFSCVNNIRRFFPDLPWID